MSQAKRTFAALALALLFSAAGQEAKLTAANAGQGEVVTPGTWGGDQFRMEVTEDGAAIEQPCARGTIEHRLTTEEGGRFRAKGTYLRERGGPEREEREREKGVPALFTGRTDGKTMTLTIKLAETNETVGTFTLAHGRKVRITKCL